MSAPPREGLYLGDPEATPQPLAAGTAKSANIPDAKQIKKENIHYHHKMYSETMVILKITRL